MMFKLLYLSLGLLIVSIPFAYADDDNQSSDSGVLVSSSAHESLLDQDSSPQDDSTDNNAASSLNLPSPSPKKNSNAPVSDDDVIVKRINAIVFQMQANLKLTPDQVSAVTPIVSETIVKVTELEQKLKEGGIDSKGMYSDRLALIMDANQQLSTILTPDQMKIWENMQDQNSGSYF